MSTEGFSSSFIMTTFDHIIQAHYDNLGKVKDPTKREVEEINSRLNEIDFVAATVMMPSGMLGLGASYLLSRIPRVGSWLGRVTGIACLIIGILGCELTLSTKNLKIFANHRFKEIQNIQKARKPLENKENIAKEDFNENMMKAAIKTTILIRLIYKLILFKNRVKNAPL